LTSNIETIILPTEAYLEFYCCPECHCILGQSFAT
jgi:hypothetical protein